MIPLALLIAASQLGEDPAAFIHRIYASYSKTGYSPLNEPEKLFSPKLAAEIRKDGSGDEVGYLDGDPLCDCQDFISISARIVNIKRPSARSAKARLHVTLGPNAARDIRLNLTLTPSGWRIADVVNPRGHSLLRELQRENARQKGD